ncbi:hypothetical protein QBC36DRAFT_194874 [Triangularia setosa]|uniref:Uncharacterized protein n=1 Tax=Triangularia setosa TaxID=2587417 RepID=A0AAN7A4V7_9PEZI|nr:hypothetical protein QBC36DRAFT_194874 [Podospora setosa]
MLSKLILRLAAASLAAANPLITPNAAPDQHNDNILKRHHETTTVTITTLAPAVTVTQNPSDPTVTRPALLTRTVGTPTFTSTITQDCLSYSFLFPPEGHTPDTQTFVYETRSTITVFDTARRITTRTVETTPTITITKPTNTVVYRHCPKTLVVSYVDHEFLTWSWTQYAGGVTRVTGLCLTSSTRSTTIPGVTLPTAATKTLEDWEYFSGDGATLATKYSVAVVYEAFPTVRERFTSTVCEAGQTTEWTTTLRVPTVTATVTGGCEGRLGKREGPVPVRVETVVYTTVTVVGNRVMTLTGTAVVDVNTAVFTRTRIAYETVGTSTVTVCGRG